MCRLLERQRLDADVAPHALVEGVHVRLGEQFFQLQLPGEDQGDAGPSVELVIGQRAEFFEAARAEEMRLVDNQQHPILGSG